MASWLQPHGWEQKAQDKRWEGDCNVLFIHLLIHSFTHTSFTKALTDFLNFFIHLSFIYSLILSCIYFCIYFLCMQLLIHYSFILWVSQSLSYSVGHSELSHSHKLLGTDWVRCQNYKMNVCPCPQGIHSWRRETDIVNRSFTHGAENKIEANRWYRNSTRKLI